MEKIDWLENIPTYIVSAVNYIFDYKYFWLIAIAILFFLTFFIIDKSLLRKKHARNEYIFVFIVMSFILFVYFYVNNKNELNNSLSCFLNKAYFSVYKLLYPNIQEENIFKVNNFHQILFILFLFLIFIGNRLSWIIYIALLEFILIFLYWKDILLLMDNQKIVPLIQSLSVIIVSSPFLLIIWVFRDNDRYKEIELKVEDLKFRREELKIREKEISLREKEILIKEKEMLLNKDS